MTTAAHDPLKLLHHSNGADGVDGGLRTVGEKGLGSGDPVLVVRVDDVAIGLRREFLQTVGMATHQQHLCAAPG